MFIKLQFLNLPTARQADFVDRTDTIENKLPVAALTAHANLALRHDHFQLAQFYQPHEWYSADVQSQYRFYFGISV